MSRLQGDQLRSLLEAIRHAFPNVGALRMAVDTELRLNLDAEVNVNDLKTASYELITRWAEPRGKVDTLVIALRRANPENPELAAFAQRLALAPRTFDGSLERAVDTFGYLDIRRFSTRLSEVQHRVALVFARNGDVALPLGTGVLVGRDLLLTNQHVEREVARLGLPRSALRARFDFFAPGLGVEFAFSAPDPDAPLPSLPHATPEVELSEDPTVEPGADELDCALLRFMQDVSTTMPLGTESPRGHERLSSQGALPTVGGGIIIVQHPDGQPMRFVVEKPGAVVSMRGERRVRYRANTEGGSSGAPCFDLDWQLVALHHLGGPDAPTGIALARWNQGIPTRTIAAHPRVTPFL